MGCNPQIKKIVMKAWHFLQASSEIIGRRRYRPDATGMTTSSHRCRLGRGSGQTQLEPRLRQSGLAYLSDPVLALHG
jgi:hypothetical protein